MTIEHLLYSMIDDDDAKDIFEACNVDINSLKKQLESFLKEKLTDLINIDVNDVKPTVGFEVIKEQLSMFSHQVKMRQVQQMF